MAEDRQNESFELLLAWLNPDRDEAWEKYREIWDRLIKIFTYCRCRDVEELAGEVIKRVEPQVPKLLQEFIGDPARHFYGVAYKVVLERPRMDAKFLELKEESEVGGTADPVDPESIDADEERLIFLDSCLEELSERERGIILTYYQFDQANNLAGRKRLAEQLGVTMDALWIRVSRIRSRLRRCMKKRSEQVGQIH